MIFDKYGVLGQIQSDGSVEGGDSVNWHSHYLYLTDRSETTAKIHITFFEIASGAYVRHPDATMTNNGFGAYYQNVYSGCISRDQLTGLLGYLIASKQHKASWRLIKHHAKRLFLTSYNTIINGRNPKETKFSIIKFFYNPKKENYYKMPDPTIADIWSMELRSLGLMSMILYPLMWITDIQIFISAIRQRKKPSNSDPISFTMKLMTCREFYPTLISWAAWKITDKEKLLKDLETYWSGWRQQPEMTALYEKKFNELGM